MATAQELLDRVKGILSSSPFEANVNSPASAKAEKQRITLSQKQLRQVKSEVNLEMKAIRATYTAAKKTAGAGGGTLLKIMGKKGAAKSHQARAKQIKELEKQKELIPYEQVITAIENALLTYDKLKLKLDQYIAQNTPQK